MDNCVVLCLPCLTHDAHICSSHVITYLLSIHPNVACVMKLSYFSPFFSSCSNIL